MTTINSDFNFKALAKSLPFVKVSEPVVKAYTVCIVLHSPTQVIEKTIYTETMEEAIHDAQEIANEWRAKDSYFRHAYLQDGTTLIKRF